MIVRESVDADLDAVTAIYAENVIHGAGTFELAPPDAAEMARRREAVLALHLPWLVAEVDGVLVGYAYVGPFRTRSAYRYTVEDSVYVLAAAHGQGVGRALLDALLYRCEALGVRQVLGVIGDSENTASIALHAACGFEPIGAMRDVGWKFDRWLDVVFMQKTLGAGGEATPDTPGLALNG